MKDIELTKEDMQKMQSELDNVAKKYGLKSHKDIDRTFYVDHEKEFTSEMVAYIMDEAVEAGMKAGNGSKPEGMVVVGRDPSSGVAKVYDVPDGPCGFAWIKVRATCSRNRKFINVLRKMGALDADRNKDGVVWTQAYGGGYQYWVGQFNQSMDRKSAFAHAFAEVLEKYGVEAYTGSRMD